MDTGDVGAVTQVSVAGGKNTHSHYHLYEGSGTGREEEGKGRIHRRSGGSRSRAGWVISWAEVPGGIRQMDGRMIRKPGREVEAGIRQTATGTGGQESRSGTEGFGVIRESDETGRSGTGRVSNG